MPGKRVAIIRSLIISIAAILMLCCSRTEGTINLEGKLQDEFTKDSIPNRDIIVQGLINRDSKLVPVETGQFSTDSAGHFKYTLRKVKDAYNYSFNVVGDSIYPFTSNHVSLLILERSSKYIFLNAKKLTDLTIIINRKSRKPAFDTLSLSWESNGVYYWNLYPYEINNYGKTNEKLKQTTELRWIGGNVNSTVSTKVFAGKRTRLRWQLFRNGKMNEFIDTITCKRDIENRLVFTY